MLKVILSKSKEITEDFKMDRIQVERNQAFVKKNPMELTIQQVLR